MSSNFDAEPEIRIFTLSLSSLTSLIRDSLGARWGHSGVGGAR